MIPENELKYLKPLPDIKARERMMKGKLHKYPRKMQAKRFRPKNHEKRDHIGLS